MEVMSLSRFSLATLERPLPPVNGGVKTNHVAEQESAI